MKEKHNNLVSPPPYCTSLLQCLSAAMGSGPRIGCITLFVTDTIEVVGLPQELVDAIHQIIISVQGHIKHERQDTSGRVLYIDFSKSSSWSWSFQTSTDFEAEKIRDQKLTLALVKRMIENGRYLITATRSSRVFFELNSIFFEQSLVPGDGTLDPEEIF
ncbi:hypothetical protein BGX28_005763 [Mortierella sp. GBA30]|nr:hypothetical protein BGX28_005763 [Mortierella sp. GBA30]